jgi:cytochrome c peroxidase
VSPFSSKFDYALANPTSMVLTDDELAGWNLFRGKAKCNTCHLDGTENITKGKITPADATDLAPLFTDFTSSNLGIPQNFALPFLYENHPDQFGYVANSEGIAYVDLGSAVFWPTPVYLGRLVSPRLPASVRARTQTRLGPHSPRNSTARFRSQPVATSTNGRDPIL